MTMRKKIYHTAGAVLGASLIMICLVPFCYVLARSFITARGVDFQSYYDVFWGCQSLSEVIIGESLKKIDGLLFSECENLTSVTFENTLGWYLQRNFGDDVQWNVTDPRANAVKLKNMFNENLICI